MSTMVICDHCKQPITEVGYALRAFDPHRIDSSPVISSAHLHWDCIPAFGRSTGKAEANS